MKYLHVIRSLNPKVGGPVEAIRQLIKAMCKAGHQAEVATMDDAAAPWLGGMETQVHALGPGWGKYGYGSQLVPWLREHGAEYGAIIVNGLWQYQGLGTWMALQKSGLPYYVFPHGMLDPWCIRQSRRKHLKKAAYWLAVEHRVLRKARAVLFTSEEERELAHGVLWPYGLREVVVNYGTSPPAGDAEEQRAVFFRRYPELRDKRLILCLGRIHPKKGCDLLVKAFARVLGEREEWQLVIAGPDESGTQGKLARLAGSLGIGARVSWPGMLTGDLKWGALQAAEAFALASHSENFGIVVAEALACGTPVLISNRVNIWREIAADGAGLVAEDTAAGTERLLREWKQLGAGERQNMRENARNCFRRRFHIQQAAASLLQVISEPQAQPAAAS